MKQNEWIIFGDTGISSKTMWAVINGVIKEKYHKGGLFDVPHDRFDFERCYQYYKSTNLSQRELNKVKELLPWFAPFIDNWDDLISLRGDEKLYLRIKELERESMILDGMVEKSPGYWVRES